jgi:hypothetical protein
MKPPDHKRIEPAVLFIKKSTLPGAGKGLFTKDLIEKGQLIVEYKGNSKTFKEIQENKTLNLYVFYVNRNFVIDASQFPDSLGRYANDAEGLATFPGIVNNAEFIVRSKRVYLKALTTILPGAEIFVAYGKEYWSAIKFNLAIDRKNKERRNKKK